MAIGESAAIGTSVLRAHLRGLEERGLLQRVKAEVDPAWEIASVARQVFLQRRPERRYALLFERTFESVQDLNRYRKELNARLPGSGGAQPAQA